MKEQVKIDPRIMDQVQELWVNWCRLQRNGLGGKRHPLTAMIDASTGFEVREMERFLEWLVDDVLARFDPEAA